MNNDAELTLRGRFGILLSASGGRRWDSGIGNRASGFWHATDTV